MLPKHADILLGCYCMRCQKHHMIKQSDHQPPYKHICPFCGTKATVNAAATVLESKAKREFLIYVSRINYDGHPDADQSRKHLEGILRRASEYFDMTADIIDDMLLPRFPDIDLDTKDSDL